MFAVAGRGESQDIPVWECQGASLWQDAVAAQGARASPGLATSWARSSKASHGLSQAGSDRALQRKPFVPLPLFCQPCAGGGLCPRCGSVPCGGAAGRLGHMAQHGFGMWPLTRKGEGPSHQPEYLSTGLVLDCWVLKSVQEPLNVNTRKGLVESN